jgi:hypothetical protein
MEVHMPGGLLGTGGLIAEQKLENRYDNLLWGEFTRYFLKLDCFSVLGKFVHVHVTV